MQGLSSGYKVYGSNAALSVESTMTRETPRHPKGLHTLSFEMATFNRSRPNDGANWDDKLTVQVTPVELPQVVASLTGFGGDLEFKFHGAQRNKSYRLTCAQGGSLTLSAPGRSHTVPLQPFQRFEIVSLAMRQLQRRHGGLSSELIYQMLTDCYRS